MFVVSLSPSPTTLGRICVPSSHLSVIEPEAGQGLTGRGAGCRVDLEAMGDGRKTPSRPRGMFSLSPWGWIYMVYTTIRFYACIFRVGCGHVVGEHWEHGRWAKSWDCNPDSMQVWFPGVHPWAFRGGRRGAANDLLTQLGDDLRPLEVGVQRRREAMLLDSQQKSRLAGDGLGSASIPLVRKPSASCVLPTRGCGTAMGSRRGHFPVVMGRQKIL